MGHRGFGPRRKSDPTMASLVLVENEVTYGGKYDHWLDSTGESYQFPNQYRTKIVEGVRFVYYRGVRRADGRRGDAEYFGVGCIGSVWRDPTVPLAAPRSKWRWFCSVDHFKRFPKPVPSKVDGTYLEAIPNTMGWRTGVRLISDETFERILRLAGLVGFGSADDSAHGPTAVPLPAITEVHVVEQKGPWQVILAATNPQQIPQVAHSESVARRSPQAKRLGDRAEEIVLKWLRTTLPPNVATTVAWVAKQGRTPGWDIEFTDAGGQHISVEVKGTTDDVFQSFEVTAHEWEAARTHGQHYWLVLVTSCASTTPQVTVISSPYVLWERGELQIEPIVWRMRRSPTTPS